MTERMHLLVATGTEVLRVDPAEGSVRGADGLADIRPTCLAVDPRAPWRAWCGTAGHGVYRSDDAGASWRAGGLAGAHVTALEASPTEPGVLWAGTEPSSVLRGEEGGSRWRSVGDLLELPSSPEWSFPPKPETHHVRWIGVHPRWPGVLWVAIEAGALVRSRDGGATWMDRVPGGPFDTHELAVHPDRPDTLRSAAGDGYFESADGGDTWATPRRGLDVGYLRSVAIDPGDPDTVVVSAATRPHSTYVAGRSDGRVYRREAEGDWTRILDVWPDPPDTIAPLLRSGRGAGELWAADERGVHRSRDGGRTWERAASFDPAPSNLRGLALVREEPSSETDMHENTETR